jgi:phosphopantetheine--protein transferase-like protein
MTDGNNAGVFASAEDFRPCSIPLHDLKSPVSGEVQLWFLDLGGLADSLRDAMGGGEEGSSPVTTGQLRFARRFYLRLLLGAYLGLPGKSVKINRQNRGKPELDKSVHACELHFSMAKSEDKLLIGFSTSSHIGVDLEPANRCARNTIGVAQRYFSPVEAESLAAMPPGDLDAAFLRVWACKEAIVKASGQGIANQFSRFSVEADGSRPAAVLAFEDEDASSWSLALVRPGNDFLGAVAIQEKLTALQGFCLLPARHSLG